MSLARSLARFCPELKSADEPNGLIVIIIIRRGDRENESIFVRRLLFQSICEMAEIGFREKAIQLDNWLAAAAENRGRRHSDDDGGGRIASRQQEDFGSGLAMAMVKSGRMAG